MNLNDKGIDGFCTMIEHATNRLAGKKADGVDKESIAVRLEMCAEAVRSGKTVVPAMTREDLMREKKVKKAKHSAGVKKKRRRRASEPVGFARGS